MTELFLLVVFKVIWQDLVKDVGYDSRKHNWQAIGIVIDEIRKNKQVNQDLAIALKKCFYSSENTIAQKCREELIQKSTFTQYRGAKIYKPPQNDKDIRILENKIKFIEKQLKKIEGKKLFDRSVFSPEQLEELLKQLSQSSPESQDNINQLFELAEKDCDINIYKTTLRDQKNGLRKQIFNSFLTEIEPHKQLNRIFNARTHLILDRVRNKS
ncbi:MAG: hypothetical protein AAF915_28495 [Cyanobacteria bacterium P01_D01_bin.50]